MRLYTWNRGRLYVWLEAEMKRYLPLLRYLSVATCLSILAAFAQQALAPQTHGIVVANIDRSVKPGDDFYRFANGDWIKRTEIPPDRAAVDVFTKLADLSNKRTNDLINEIAKSNARRRIRRAQDGGSF